MFKQISNLVLWKKHITHVLSNHRHPETKLLDTTMVINSEDLYIQNILLYTDDYYIMINEYHGMGYRSGSGMTKDATGPRKDYIKMIQLDSPVVANKRKGKHVRLLLYKRFNHCLPFLL